MKKSVRKYIREHNLLHDSDPVVVGVSGGVDSMSLLHVLHELGYDVLAVHFNHELRGSESDADVECVSDYCSELCISFVQVQLGRELKNMSGSGSIQARARRLRYVHLRSIAVARGIHRVAVAHNRNDQAETVLLNLKRGTGLDGMAGMRPARLLNHYDPNDFHPAKNPPNSAEPILLIRPLLHIRRRELEKYVTALEIPWRDDTSNQDLRYTRNRIRHEIIPEQSRDTGPDFIDDIAEAANAVARVVDDVFPRSLPGPLRNWRLLDRRLPVDLLLSLPTVLRSWLYLRALRHWLPAAPARATTISAIESLLQSQPGRRVQFDSGCVWRDRTTLYFDCEPSTDGWNKGHESMLESNPVELVPGIPVRLDNRFLALDLDEEGANTGGDLKQGDDALYVFLDFGKVSGPLRLRHWQAGDRFIPLGMKGSKKVKSYLTDVKVESSLRRRTSVVCDDEKIVWLVGHRLDDRVRLDKGSKIVARLSIRDKLLA